MSFSQEEQKFLDLVTVSTIVPQKTNVALNEVFGNDDENGSILLADVKQRDTLFFDEQLKVYMVLRLPEGPEEKLKDYLSRLHLAIEAWVVEGSDGVKSKKGSSNPEKDLVYSQTVNHDDDPMVLVSQSEDEGDEKLYLNLIWETAITLHRPRTRMADAHVVIVPNATIRPREELNSDDDYIMPFETQEQNLFRPLKGARGFEDQVPYLPVSRLQLVQPPPSKEDRSYHVKSHQSQTMRTHTVCVTRMKYSKSSQSISQSSLVASLDIEMVPNLGISGTIEKSEMSMGGGTVTPLMNDFLPMEWQSRECLTLLFQLDQAVGKVAVRPVGQSTRLANSAMDTLMVSLNINIHLDESCTARVHIEWTTNVDFSQALNSAFGPPSQSLQRSNRPSSLPFGSGNGANAPSTSTQFKPDGHISHDSITISFAAPAKPAKVGVPFVWQVLVVNRSPKTAKLAIIPLPRIQRSSTQAQKFAKRHAQRNSQISTHHSEKAHNTDREDLNIAPAFIDENIVYAMQHAGAVPPETDLLSLTAELRVGPLGPGQCHEAEIKLVAFKKGALAVDAIRIVDLVREAEEGAGSPGVVTDCRDLPDVLVE